jgi:HEAT repeat protein
MSAWALGNIEARSAVTALTAAAEGDKDAKVRETSVWALGNIEDGGTAQALGRIIASDQSDDVRAMAAWALGQLDLKTAPQGLIDALAASDIDLRTRAAWALGEIGDARALPAIRTAFGKETDARARKAELRAMAHSGARSDEFEALLQSKDAEIRKTAVRAIAGQDGLDPWPWPMPRPRPFP